MLYPSIVSRIPTAFGVVACVFALVAASGCAEVDEILDVRYDERYGGATSMDVYMPTDGGDRRPAVMMIHGGGWRLFSKSAYTDHAARLAGAGYVAATINYRLVPDGAYPALIQDCVCALAHLRANADTYGIDPDRVAVLGYSAGGHLASLLGVGITEDDFQPSCDAGTTGPPNAVISGAGPQDMRELPEVDSVTEFLGGTRDEVPEIYDRASPITHVHSGAPPYLFIHGTTDVFVDVEQSEDMRDALTDVGVDARLLTVSGGGHLFNMSADGTYLVTLTSTDIPEAWAATVDFLDSTVGPP